jgi:hypothetical protein
MKRWILLLLLIPSVLASPNVYEFGEDYWFEDEGTLKTSTGSIYAIEEMMPYTVEGEVVGVRFYKEEEIPFGLADVALVWGDLLTAEFMENLEVSMAEHRHCNYVYAVTSPEITSYYVRTHMSNNHLIPASREIFENILEIQTGDYVTMTGSLVYITGERESNGRIEKLEWGPSSTTLEDQGDHACEIILVRSLEFAAEEVSMASPEPDAEEPFTEFERFYTDLWKILIILIVAVSLLIYLLSKLFSSKQPSEEPISPQKYEMAAKMMEYYNKKGYRILRYTVQGSLLKIVISKDTRTYLAEIDLRTKRVSYRSI